MRTRYTNDVQTIHAVLQTTTKRYTSDTQESAKIKGANMRKRHANDAQTMRTQYPNDIQAHRLPSFVFRSYIVCAYVVCACFRIVCRLFCTSSVYLFRIVCASFACRSHVVGTLFVYRLYVVCLLDPITLSKIDTNEGTFGIGAGVSVSFELFSLSQSTLSSYGFSGTTSETRLVGDCAGGVFVPESFTGDDAFSNDCIRSSKDNTFACSSLNRVSSFTYCRLL